MYSFESLYGAVVVASFIAGFCFPGTVKRQQKQRNFVLQVYSVLSTAPLMYVIVCNLILQYTVSGLFDLKLYGVNTIVIVTVIDTYYYLSRKREFVTLLEDFDAVTDSVLTSQLTRDRDVTFVLARAKKFNSISKRVMVWVLFQNVSAPLYFMCVHFLYSKTQVFIDVPHPLSSLALLFVTWFTHMFAGLLASIKIVCFWGVIFLFLHHVVAYLRALRQSFHGISANSEHLLSGSVSLADNSVTDNAYIIVRLREWVQLHQSIIR